jgi:hypothetical protein
MKLRIEKRDGGLEVRIDGIEGQERAVIEAIHRCRQSAWACPSGECMNIESIAEQVAGGCALFTLTARPGAELSSSGIEQCLRYMLPQAAKVQ